jgi:hypothetical protein
MIVNDWSYWILKEANVAKFKVVYYTNIYLGELAKILLG